MERRKVRIKEDNEYLKLLLQNIEGDFKAMKDPGFYIEVKEGYEEVIVLIFGESSLINQINGFEKHLINHYIEGKP